MYYKDNIRYDTDNGQVQPSDQPHGTEMIGKYFFFYISLFIWLQNCIDVIYFSPLFSKENVFLFSFPHLSCCFFPFASPQNVSLHRLLLFGDHVRFDDLIPKKLKNRPIDEKEKWTRDKKTFTRALGFQSGQWQRDENMQSAHKDI